MLTTTYVIQRKGDGDQWEDIAEGYDEESSAHYAAMLRLRGHSEVRRVRRTEEVLTDD